MSSVAPRPDVLTIHPYVAGESEIAGLNRTVKLSSNEGAFGVPPSAQAAIARTTRYTLTTERCIMRYGVALTANLSLPLRRMASVSVAAREGGAGDILLKLKPGASRVRYLKLWPHVRPWRFKVAEPMLRGVPDAITVAALLSHAVAQVSPGVLHSLPEKVRATLPGAILSPAGD